MIIGYIKGQELQLKSELIVADTIDYLTAKFVFKTADWQGLSKWAHFKKGDTVYDIPLTADSITKSDHLNLAEGEWEVYLHGNAFDGGEVVERITTETAKLTVKGTGTLNGEPFPEIPASETERINAELADHEERIAEIEEHGGGGGTGDYNDLENKPSINGVELSGNKTTEQLGIEIPSLEGYATESYVNNYHDATKQDVISDLDSIRSGAALGATALQEVPSTYRTASAQDVIDNGKVDKSIVFPDYRDKYINGSLTALASWIAADVGTHCINGTLSGDVPKAVLQYRDGYGYYQYMSFDRKSDFIYDDTLTVGGTEYHVAYMDCACMVSLLTKGRKYTDSMYYYFFTEANPDADVAYTKGLEYGYNNQLYPWTFDWLNNPISYRMAYMMDMNGRALRRYAYNNGSNVEFENLGDIDTGDILFIGNSTHPDNYKEISHVAYYLKDLEELNSIMSDEYGVSVKTYNDHVDEGGHGYIVEVTAATDGSWSEGGYQDVLRISTLDDYMAIMPSGATHKVCYVASGIGNSMLSTKALKGALGIEEAKDGFYISERYEQNKSLFVNAAQGIIGMKQAQISGAFTSGSTVDLNTLDTGFVMIDGSSTTIINRPSGSTAQIVYVITVYSNSTGTRKIQFYLDGNSDLFFRVKKNNSEYYAWRRVPTKANMLSIADTAGYFTSDTVEGALAEIGAELAGGGGGGGTSTIAWKPTVDAQGNISWQRTSSETVPETQNIKGPQGPAYTLTDADKATIVQAVIDDLPKYDGSVV